MSETARNTSLVTLGELKRFGPASQSAVLGSYAWMVTVAPLAWATHAPAGTWLIALAAPLALAASIAIEAKSPRVALVVGAWGALAPSVVVWIRTTDTPSASLDPSRAVLGFLGWAAFAFVVAAPPIGQAHVDSKRSEHAPSFVPRVERSRAMNAATMLVAAIACGVLQWPRSDGSSTEREVFIRVVALAASLLIAARAGDIVASSSRKIASARIVSRVLPPLLWLFSCAVLGVLAHVFLGER